MIAIEAGSLFDGEANRGAGAVLIEQGRVVDVLPRAPDGISTTRLAPGTLLAPGFVDLQVNGGGGVLFNDQLTVAGLRRIADVHVRVGTTALLPTLISGDRAAMVAAIAAVRDALAQSVAGIAGLHIEGPFINRARRGIHPEAAMTALTEGFDFLFQPAGLKLLLTLAPEIVASEHVARLADAGIAVFLGHTDATFEVARDALDVGAVAFTHLFNAMSQLGSRAPGVVGAALDHATAHASIIVDGWHVDPAAIRVAWRALGPARLALISDAMPSVGAGGDGGFTLAGKPIRLIDGRLTDTAGTLAGAHLTMLEAVRNAVHLVGIPLDDALRMATATPADALRLPDHGRIRAGGRADLVALDENLALVGVWVGGERLK